MRLLLQFHHPLVYVLLAATAVTLALGKWTDAAVIFGVVLLNAVIGFAQEARAQRALEALAAMLQTESTLVRGGRKERVCSADVVPGDVVLLEPGGPGGARTTWLRRRSAGRSGSSPAAGRTSRC